MELREKSSEVGVANHKCDYMLLLFLVRISYDCNTGFIVVSITWLCRESMAVLFSILCTTGSHFLCEDVDALNLFSKRIAGTTASQNLQRGPHESAQLGLIPITTCSSEHTVTTMEMV